MPQLGTIHVNHSSKRISPSTVDERSPSCDHLSFPLRNLIPSSQSAYQLSRSPISLPESSLCHRAGRVFLTLPTGALLIYRGTYDTFILRRTLHRHRLCPSAVYRRNWQLLPTFLPQPMRTCANPLLVPGTRHPALSLPLLFRCQNPILCRPFLHMCTNQPL